LQVENKMGILLFSLGTLCVSLFYNLIVLNLILIKFTNVAEVEIF